MEDDRIYRIEILGRVEADELSAASPLQMTFLQAGPQSTLLSICTDQSGLIGLLRYLHGRGLAILSVQSDRSK